MLLLLLCLAVGATSSSAPPPAQVTHSAGNYTLSNGYVRVVLASQSGASIVSLAGDFEGAGVYGEELLAHGFAGTGFALQSMDGPNETVFSSHDAATAPTVTVVSDGPALAAIKVEGVQAGAATEVWSLELEAGSRGFRFNTTGSLPAGARPTTVVRHTLLATPLSVYGFYPNDGVVQMMNAGMKKSFMTTARPLERVYMLGGINPGAHQQLIDGSPKTSGAIDIHRHIESSAPGVVTALISGQGAESGTSGFQCYVHGNVSFPALRMDSWGPGDASDEPTGIPAGSGCIAFRATDSCWGPGGRDPKGDRSCNATIPCTGPATGSKGEAPLTCPSGYCECEGGTSKAPKGPGGSVGFTCHVGSRSNFTCAEICASNSSAFAVAPASAPFSTAALERASIGTSSTASSWSTSMTISPNNHNFPAGELTTTKPNLPTQDLAALMTGIYGSAPGCLCTFPNSPSCPGMEGEHQKLGQIATTVARGNGDRGYAGTYNYFDPDNFFSMTALIYSGEPFLQEQARFVIERSGAFLCIGDVQKKNKCTYGQLPHHFKGTTPTFLALSGATQTGPNTFWTKSALQYARNSGNKKWLVGYMPTLRAAASFCFDLIDDKTKLLLAPGSLMIDVFIRANYTADSNAMMVGFLNEFADAEEVVGNSTGAAALRSKASAMKEAMMALLWDGTDHFVTQVDPDRMDCAKSHSCRDFVDYDSNTIAVAHNVATIEQGKQVLHRIDHGSQKCVAAQGGGPQWVSEKYYGKHDTTGGNIGDSASAMGRIAWFDAKARKVVGDVDGFETQLKVLQNDLLEYTWMHERYGCDGKMQTNRTAAYFEYPSTVAILLREIRYGITLGFDHVTVDPMPQAAFSYHVGNVDIDFTPNGTSYIHVPVFATEEEQPKPTEYRLHGMRANANYTVTSGIGCTAAAAAAAAEQQRPLLLTKAAPDGLLRFSATPGAGCGVAVAAAWQ